MTRYNEWEDDTTWNTKYNECDCDYITLGDAQTIIDQFIISNPSYALTSENPKLRKRATTLLQKRQAYKDRLLKILETLNGCGISSQVAIEHLPQLKESVLALNDLLKDVSNDGICITQFTKDISE